ncbi:MAG: hypothetical protein ACTHJS_09485 [Xanthobacteraceae bacterium]
MRSSGGGDANSATDGRVAFNYLILNAAIASASAREGHEKTERKLLPFCYPTRQHSAKQGETERIQDLQKSKYVNAILQKTALAETVADELQNRCSTTELTRLLGRKERSRKVGNASFDSAMPPKRKAKIRMTPDDGKPHKAAVGKKGAAPVSEKRAGAI